MAKNSQYETYAYLDRLSTEQLEELLRADFISPDQNKEEAIFHILEVIAEREKKNPTGRLPDPDQAWADFKQYFYIPEGEGQSLYPVSPEQEDPPAPVIPIRKPHRQIRKSFIAAAVLAVLFCGMLTAQASGIDILEALGRWTEETFHFNIFSTEEIKTERNESITEKMVAFREAAASCGIPHSMIPTWIPEGFELSEPKIQAFENYTKAVSCEYTNSAEGRSYSIYIEHYQNTDNIQDFDFEKDNSNVSLYQSGEKVFYIMSNLETLTATWSDGSYLITIRGSLQMDEIEAIINSIGG